MAKSTVESPYVPERLEQWLAAKNYVSVGNLGEQVAARLLISLDYQLLGAQDDFVGMVSAVLGEATNDNPEDFIAIDPQGRLVVNSKATISPRSCRVRRDGNLGRPRIGPGQNRTDYSTRRASLISPLDGDSFSQVIKVDLRHARAQIFEVDDYGVLGAISEVFDVAALVSGVLALYPDEMPPPRVWDLAD